MKKIYDDIIALDGKEHYDDLSMYSTNRKIKFELVFDDECPLCGYGMEMGNDSKRIFHDFSQDETQYECRVACIHYCPHCKELFVSEHEMIRGINGFQEKSHQVHPYSVTELKIPKEIEPISDSFPHLYLQAIMAKHYGLTDIYGMALRKALEHLVKDYALFNNPHEESTIAKKSLANCINDYINDVKVKTLCTSCRLIGNNETHWRSSNTTEDLTLMEKVMRAVIHFIEQEIIVKEAEEYIVNHGNGMLS